MTDPTDDQLRAALRAEAEGVTASDELLARIRAQAVSTSPTRHVGRWLLAAAAVAAVIGGTAVVLASDEGDRPEGLDVADDPTTTDSPTTTTVPETSTSTTEATTTTTEEPAVEPARPEQVVAVTEDGRLVTIDVRSGEETSELYALDDPALLVPEGGPYSISGARVSGDDVYLETCCEPAVGNVLRTPLDQPGYLSEHDHETVLNSSFIDVSADGSTMTGMSGAFLMHLDLETGDLITFEPDVDEVYEYGQTVVNRDGTQIAVERALERDDDPCCSPVRSEIILFEVQGRDLVEIERHAPTQGGRMFASFVDGTDLVAGEVAPYRSFSTDSSGRHLLTVQDDGSLWWDGYATGETEQIAPGQRFLAADW